MTETQTSEVKIRNNEMIEDNPENAVKIAVRECPSEQVDSITYYNSEVKNILIAGERPFVFDFVFESNVVQKEIFDSLAKPLIHKTLEGYNCNILAYGQTGTGKTYTMGLTQNFQDECAGIIPRCLKEIFQVDGLSYRKIFVSYIEIYNEKVFDMLSSDPSEQVNVKGYKFNGGQKREIKSAEHGINCLIQGNRNRHVRPTKMNAQSSRSHAIFTIHLEQKSDIISSVSVLNLVDLAGSEGVRRTGHQGIALSEGVNINQGLLSVGKVVQALNSGNKVIPYRDSILTSVLQDSLNLRSYLTLLACISSDKIDRTETMSTLRFAQNAKSLRNHPSLNAVLREYQKQKQKTPSKLTTPLRVKNMFTPYTKKPNFKTMSSLKKSNSFCSPRNVNSIVAKRLNNTDVRKNGHIEEYKKLNKNLHNKGKDSIESRSSISSLLNASSSTALDAPTVLSSSPNHLINLDFVSNRNVDHFYKFMHEDNIIQSENNVTQSEVVQSIQKSDNENLWRSMKGDLRLLIKKELMSLTKKNIEPIREETPQKAFHGNLFKENFLDDLNIVEQEISGSKLSSTSNVIANKHRDINLEIPASTITDQTSTPVQFSKDLNLDLNSLKVNIRDIIREELTTLVENAENVSESTFKAENSEVALESSNKFEESLFKEPDWTFTSNRIYMKRFGVLNSTQDTIVFRPRRSQRLSRDSNISEHKNLRRSLRLEKKEIGRHQSTRIDKVQEENVKEQSYSSRPQKVKNEKTKTNLLTTNKIMSGFLNNITNQNSKATSKAKHQKAVLGLLNNGTMKELQILPYIGLKTAYQIVTHRTLNGKFKNFDSVSKLPVWRGKAWDRFKEANNL